MSVRRRRATEQGQALLMALVLLGLLSAFSVAALRLGSVSVITAATVRQSAYTDALRQAGSLMARQVVAAGLGCSPSSSTLTASFSRQTVTVRVAKPPADCAGSGVDSDGDGGTVPGDYVLCAVGTDRPTGVAQTATVTVSATPKGGGSMLAIDIVHFEYGRQSPC